MAIDVACSESQEQQTLPVLAEWRATQRQALAAGLAHAPRHTGAHRADALPRA
jgi:hypothetical protein